MSEITYDIGDMLDGLGLTTAAIRWKEILENPALGNYTAQQLLREVLTPQYVEAINRRYETNLRLSRLINRSAKVSNLKTGNGRKYNDDTVSRSLHSGLFHKVTTLGFMAKPEPGNPTSCLRYVMKPVNRITAACIWTTLISWTSS